MSSDEAADSPMTDGPGLALSGRPLAGSPGESAYAAIRKAVLNGTLRPGERIVEQQLAEQLNVSRTPVREALFKLERETSSRARAGA